MARPKVGPHRMMLTLDDETYQALKAFGASAGKRPATMVREILSSSLPQIKSALTVIEHAKKGFISEAVFEGLTTTTNIQREISKTQNDLLSLSKLQSDSKKGTKSKK